MSNSASGLSHRQRTLLNSAVIASVITALAVIIGAFITTSKWSGTSTNSNIVSLTPTSSPSVSDSTSPIFWPPTNFKVTSMHGGEVIKQEELPLKIKGTYSSQGPSGEVWVVLLDSKGQYYIQNPPVRFQTGGEWVAYNVQPLAGINEIDFEYVDQTGSTFFENLVNQGDFGAFSTLPANHKTLATISIVSEASTSV